MYTLFGSQGSGSAAIEAALERVGATYRLVSAASWDAESAIDELRAVNPLVQVPTLLLEDGTVLTESAAILIHLGLAHPASDLLPAAATTRAAAIRGLVFIAANCYSAISVTDFPERWLADPSDAARQNLKDGSRARLHAHWAIFADTFRGAPYLSGAKLGALDLLAAVVSKWSGTREYLARERPHLLATLQRIEADPQVGVVLGRYFPT